MVQKSLPAIGKDALPVDSVELGNEKSLSKDKFGRKVTRRNGPRHGLSRAEIKRKIARQTGDPEFLRPDSSVVKSLGKKEGEHMLKSDISPNDPNDPNTVEKLRGLLSTGGFNFNEKERKALSKIID